MATLEASPHSDSFAPGKSSLSGPTAAASASISLLPEIWSVILGFLHRGRPEPLSRPPRSAMYQSDLLQAMLSCRLFYNLSQTILYNHIHTDQFPSMLRSISDPAMRRRFSVTKSLHIEYRERTANPTYKQIFAYGDIAWGVLDQPSAAQEKNGSFLQSCGVELKNLCGTLRSILQIGTLAIFPRLTTITVSSAYGVEAGTWGQYEMKYGKDAGEDTLGDCSDLFDKFLSSSAVQHLCIRNQQGPLCIGPLPDCGLNHASFPYSRTLHFNARPPLLPLPDRLPIRWVSDIKSDQNWSDILVRLGTAVACAREIRKFQGSPRPANVDIYGSTSVRLPATIAPKPGSYNLNSCIDSSYSTALTIDAQRKIAKQAGAALQTFLRETSGVKDIVRFHPSADIPICVACGSGPPK